MAYYRSERFLTDAAPSLCDKPRPGRPLSPPSSARSFWRSCLAPRAKFILPQYGDNLISKFRIRAMLRLDQMFGARLRSGSARASRVVGGASPQLLCGPRARLESVEGEKVRDGEGACASGEPALLAGVAHALSDPVHQFAPAAAWKKINNPFANIEIWPTRILIDRLR